ncbi:MAG: RDD family protein [Bacteroidetes bacterium]|nr:MAG: RDD family protein [Bacteroidota bacterium]
MENLTDSQIEDTEVYPLISDRYKAFFIDALVMIGFWYIFSMIFSSFDNVPKEIRFSAYLFSVWLYEPLFVSVFGASIGHYSGGMRVVRESDRTRKINIVMAIFRYAIKLLLGILSLLTITKANKGRAIHDMVALSIVIFKDSEEKTT